MSKIRSKGNRVIQARSKDAKTRMRVTHKRRSTNASHTQTPKHKRESHTNAEAQTRVTHKRQSTNASHTQTPKRERESYTDTEARTRVTRLHFSPSLRIECDILSTSLGFESLFRCAPPRKSTKYWQHVTRRVYSHARVVEFFVLQKFGTNRWICSELQGRWLTADLISMWQYNLLFTKRCIFEHKLQ